MNTNALHKISYGLYVVCSRKDTDINGQIANAVFQVTSEPPQIAVCINRKNLTWEFIKASGVLSISILCEDTPLEFIGGFGFKSGRDVNKFDGIKYKTGTTGAPIVVDNTVAYLETKLTNELDVGTHTIFITELVDAEVLTEEICMTYEHYHKVKRGGTPKTAPHYIAPKKG